MHLCGTSRPLTQAFKDRPLPGYLCRIIYQHSNDCNRLWRSPAQLKDHHPFVSVTVREKNIPNRELEASVPQPRLHCERSTGNQSDSSHVLSLAVLLAAIDVICIYF
ncbi:hypothetical protein FRC19_010998 [Serendipita sp. 401]|nr:hypothetical protein FRC19_010998 [Serendipita sp. 401]